MEVAKLRGLQSLKLPARVTDVGAKELSVLTNLRTLSLMDCKGVTDRGMRYLRPMVRLEVLYLGFTGVTDAGLDEFRPLRSLRLLDLRHTAVSRNGLAALGGMSKLDYLDLSDTNVRNADVQSLRMKGVRVFLGTESD